jgi:hypothetical protein
MEMNEYLQKEGRKSVIVRKWTRVLKLATGNSEKILISPSQFIDRMSAK